ncbi:PREDICTED: uncharacterized protein LOC109192676 [Ipomoea nil]|uniref:uncharacterized protein LOC109192676 n=1 Tax=Ipomoea nil TaxID=35883 RepID=UPI000901A8A6|nr:PREDICTED: uncharacterized protein LOC109192676 [Ipomoea nil]
MKVGRVHAERIRVQLGFEGLFYVDSSDLSGGIALLWRENNTARLLSYSKNYVDVEVTIAGFLACMRSGGNPHPNSLLHGFGDAIEDCGLAQMPMDGYQYTWENGKGTVDLLEERRDKVLVTNEWRNIVVGARVTNLATRKSDHSALFLGIHESLGRGGAGRRGFRFEIGWLYDEGCRGVVEQSWQEGRGQGLQSCIEYCGARLTRWGGDRYHKYGEQILHLKKEQQRYRGCTDPASLAEFQRLEQLLSHTKTQEDAYWRQRAKQHWLKGADANTKFFHRYASHRKKKNTLSMLMNDNGDWVEGEAMKGKNTPELVTDLRPIALSNVVYRIMAKVITNRMKPLMDEIISESQSAFIPDRLITDNILLAAEVGHFLKRKQCGTVGWSALKLDMTKAYDRMEWPFLRNMMLALGFDARWVELIMVCVITVSYNFLVNGSRSDPIVPTRGLRQGMLCPLIYDSLLFFKANMEEANEIKKCMSVYENLSGQVVNYHKSNICYSRNTSDADKENVAQVLAVVQAPNFGKYLGLPSFVGRNKKAAFSYIEDKIRQRIGSWNKRLLSQAAKSLICSGVRRRIGNGKSTLIWAHPWLQDDQEPMIQTEMPIQLAGAKVVGLIDQESGTWDHPILTDLFQPSDVANIQRIPVSPDYDDTWYWHGDMRGIYFVKSGYRLIVGNYESNVGSFTKWLTLWKLKIPPKWRMFLWRAISDILPTTTNLLIKRVDANPQCAMCGIIQEDTMHALVLCDFARNIWEQSNLPMPNIVTNIFHVWINETEMENGMQCELKEQYKMKKEMKNHSGLPFTDPCFRDLQTRGRKTNKKDEEEGRRRK